MNTISTLDALTRRLGWYTTAAASIAALAPVDTEAQVISYAFDPDVSVRNDQFSLDFDHDGDPELIFDADRQGELMAYAHTGGDVMTRVIGQEFCFAAPYYYCYLGYSWYDFWRPLGDGIMVQPGLMFTPQNWGGVQFIGGPHGGADPFDWTDRARAAIGLEFRLDGVTHYGWVGLTVPPSEAKIRIAGYAYQATPNTPIRVGEVSTAPPAYPINATLSQTDFPANGGSTTLTVEVTNTTSDTDPLALWVVARRGGHRTVLQLGTITVAPGATDTWTFELTVPADLPGARYSVQVNAGHFPAVVDTEAFTIRKEDAPGEDAPGEDGDVPIIVAAPSEAGPATAEAFATAAPVPSYVLSATRPNPFSGQTVFTLAVAEGQTVHVEVLDALGRRVALLHDGALAAEATHRFTLDGSDLAAGAYAVRVVGETFADVRVVTLTR